MTNVFSASRTIHAPTAVVWEALTIPARMTEWMGEPEMEIRVTTDWQVGASIVMRGVHHVRFENNGIVLRYEKEKWLSYTHRSSVSRLADVPENYAVLTFSLTPQNGYTLLALDIRNFPTETIQRHLEFYWRTTLTTLQEWVENH